MFEASFKRFNPAYIQGGVPTDQRVLAPIAVRVKASNDEEYLDVYGRTGQEILERWERRIALFLTTSRINARAGIVANHKFRREDPELTMTYQVRNGREILILELHAQKKPVVPPIIRPDMLVIEFVWRNTGTVEDIPYMYPVAGNLWGGVKVDAFPAWATVCGSVSVIVDGYPFAGIRIADSELPFFPPLLTHYGKPDRFELVWASTEDSLRYAYTGGGIGGSGTTGRVGIDITGPDACSATVVGYNHPGSISGTIIGHWVGSRSYPIGETPSTSPPFTGFLSTRYKGFRDIDPKILLARADFLTEAQVAGEAPFVGAKGAAGVNWDDYDMAAIPVKDPANTDTGLKIDTRFSDGRPVYRAHYRERYGGSWQLTDAAQAKCAEIGPAAEAVQVMWSLASMKHQPKPFMAKVRLQGFWRNPRNGKGLYSMWPSVGDRDPNEFYPSEVAAVEAFNASLLDPANEDFYYDPVPPISAGDVTVIATYVWGELDVLDFEDDPSQYTQKSEVFEPQSVVAQQAGQNEPQPVAGGGFGHKFGILQAHLDIGLLKLVPDDEEV